MAIKNPFIRFGAVIVSGLIIGYAIGSGALGGSLGTDPLLTGLVAGFLGVWVGWSLRSLEIV